MNGSALLHSIGVVYITSCFIGLISAMDYLMIYLFSASAVGCNFYLDVQMYDPTEQKSPAIASAYLWKPISRPVRFRQKDNPNREQVLSIPLRNRRSWSVSLKSPAVTES